MARIFSLLLLAALLILATIGSVSAQSVAKLTLEPTQVPGGAPAIGTVTLESAAPKGGVTVTLSANGSTVASVPAQVKVPHGQKRAEFKVNTKAVTADTSATISATVGSSSQSATLDIVTVDLASVEVDPLDPVIGEPIHGYVTLTWLAPTGGISVSLQSNATDVTVTGPVTVQAGQWYAPFKIDASGVTSPETVVITAQTATATKTATIKIQAVALAGIALGHDRVVGGNSTTGEVVLDGPAPASGVTITVSSSDSTVALVDGVDSTTVNVPSGAWHASFTVTTTTVTSKTVVTITATYNGVTKTERLTIH